MAKSKSTARQCAELSKLLVSKLSELHVARDHRPTSAAASVAHESLVIDVWSLQFQIANLKILSEPVPTERERLQRLIVESSKQIAEHERRLTVARKSLADDDAIDAVEHDQQQQDLASNLLQLAKR